MKGFKLKLSEALGFHGLTAKLVEEEMNDKGHNRASEEKLVKMRERGGGGEREGGREGGRKGRRKEDGILCHGGGSCTGRRGERGSGGLGRYYIHSLLVV